MSPISRKYHEFYVFYPIVVLRRSSFPPNSSVRSGKRFINHGVVHFVDHVHNADLEPAVLQVALPHIINNS